MLYTILDCYTDEPSGLGVPPYLGTYPRYLAGAVSSEKGDYCYLTVDDLRLWKKYGSVQKKTKESEKTNIRVHNLTKNYPDVSRILKKTDVLIVVIGVQTPGKYLSAVPGTLSEVVPMIKELPCRKVLTGPAAMGGTQLYGGKHFEQVSEQVFDEIDFNYKGINEFPKIKRLAVAGASILNHIPYEIIAEIETMKGCIRGKGCSFCTEPLKNRFSSREQGDIIDEMKALYSSGVRHFRLGKQTCFYTYKNYNPAEVKKLLAAIRKSLPQIKTLHIDNVNPAYVVGKHGREITKLIVEHCTPGNVAAFGAETFDEEVVKKNNLNTTPEQTFDAVRIINEIGGMRGSNGMPCFLPGINLIFGLNGESKETFSKNYYWLKKILDSNLLLRRINIRQLAVFPGTEIAASVGNKFVKKNRKHYWGWRKKIREEIDLPMLKKLVPSGTVLKEVRAEIYDGKTTFARQFGTYPLIVGITGRVPLEKYFSVKVTGHLLRSITGVVS
ncbi:radical SAM protein [Candidatus Woesearchaeota archaeon]|nr:radical SAM protein [Candidatus Woesearchaeota archaeon]